jgi:hypothetical protein
MEPAATIQPSFRDMMDILKGKQVAEPTTNLPATEKFAVFVDDNFHYMDESERYKLGEFDTFDEAVAACKRIVDEFLLTGLGPTITAEVLFKSYTMFGEDPFIVTAIRRQTAGEDRHHRR